MKTKTARINRSILIAAIAALVGFSGIAAVHAYDGRGMRGGYGPNADCPRYRDGRGPGAASLTDEQVAAVEKLRSEFQKATADLRGELRQKELALRAELAKKTPDEAAAKALQAEVSNLSADLDAKRLAHRLEVQKIAPDSCYGYGPHHGRGGKPGRWN